MLFLRCNEPCCVLFLLIYYVLIYFLSVLMMYVLRSQDDLQQSASSFHHVDPKDWTQFVNLPGKCYLESFHCPVPPLEELKDRRGISERVLFD